MAQWVKNMTGGWLRLPLWLSRNEPDHEDVGLISGLDQWVKDLVLP